MFTSSLALLAPSFTGKTRHVLLTLMASLAVIATACSPNADNDVDCSSDEIDVCAEPACAALAKCTVPDEIEHCYNGVDDNGDGLIDCDDESCKALFICLEDIEDCINGRDDDHDGKTDCQDPACAETSVCKPGAEACSGGVDEDNDGQIDCDDDDCKAVFACLVSIELPDNNVDDDEDGLVDCMDPDIARTSACIPDGEQCDDNTDNDQDGRTDCADVDCANTRVCLLGKEVCNNGIDDNGDGLLDCADTSCQGNAFCLASNLVEVCIPGSGDEDRNGQADCQDPTCRYVWHCLIEGMPDLCTRLDAAGTPDCSDPDCGAEPACQMTPEVCDDGIDNDRDGLTDCDDVDDCLLRNLGDDSNACLQLFCGDPNANNVIRSVNAFDFDTFDGSSLPIYSPDDITNVFPEGTGPTVLRGNLRLSNNFDDPAPYTIPANSLRCILPERGATPDSGGSLVVENIGPPLTSGLEDLAISGSISIALSDESAHLDGLSGLRHLLGNLTIDETIDPNLMKPTSRLGFDGLENLATIRGSIQYRSRVSSQPTRPFTFDALTSLVEVKGDLIDIKESGFGTTATGACFWNQFDTNDDVNGRFEGYYATVESFAGLGALRRIGGDVCLAATSPGGVNLAGLENLESIEGDFIIAYQDAPPTLATDDIIPVSYDGLSNLRHVGKTFGTHLGQVEVDSEFFTIAMPVDSYAGLENLTSIGGHFVVVMGENFDNFAALSNLQSIGGHLLVQGELNNATPAPIFSNLSSLQRIDRTLHLKDTNASTFAGLENLTSIGGLELYGNRALTSLSILGDAITTFPQGSLTIDAEHDVLAGLDGLENLTQVGRSVYISGQSLRELQGRFDNLQSVGERLWLQSIQESDTTRRITYRQLFPTLTTLGGLHLESVDLTSLSGLSFGSETVTHGIILQDLPFLQDNPEPNGVTTINGDVQVLRVPLSHLDFLSDVTTISGSLVLDGNPNLTTMAGLQSLNFLGQSLLLQNNAMLDSLQDLNSLTSIPGDLVIQANPTLNNIDALDQLTNVQGYVIISDTALLNLVGIQNLETVGQSFTLSNNPALTDTSDLHSAFMVNGSIFIEDNNALTALQGITQPIIFGELIVKNNATLTTLELATLTEVQQGLKIQNNDSLIDLSGLSAITRISDFLYVAGNASLSEFNGGSGDGDGLKNLTTLDGALYLFNNPVLNTPQPLLNLTAFSGAGVSMTGQDNMRFDPCAILAHLRSLGYMGTPTLDSGMTCP